MIVLLRFLPMMEAPAPNPPSPGLGLFLLGASVGCLFPLIETRVSCQRVSPFDFRRNAAICPKSGANRRCLLQAQNDVDGPLASFRCETAVQGSSEALG